MAVTLEPRDSPGLVMRSSEPQKLALLAETILYRPNSVTEDKDEDEGDEDEDEEEVEDDGSTLERELLPRPPALPAPVAVAEGVIVSR